MKQNTNKNNVFSRYDLAIETDGQKARKVSNDEQLQKIANHLISGDEEALENTVKETLMVREPLEVINYGLIPGMDEVSRLWKSGAYFLPQVILSSDAMMAGISLCEQKLGKAIEKKAKVLTHTAEGDIHDIGQLIVNALLNASGFEVINLGADVPVDTVVDSCRTLKPVMLTGTALMTTTMTAFPKIASKLLKYNIHIPFVCGGGGVTEEYVTGFDLGIWGKNASQAPAMAEDALKGLSWEEMRKKWNG